MALQENSLDVTRRDRKIISSLDQIDKMLHDMFMSLSSQLMIMWDIADRRIIKGVNKLRNLSILVRV